ncbi:Rz1-like lysis system protein LysC [Serratia marcescens]|uniref:Rz1-like lysis system protein LysC n=1 Tax=Serratia marcescens TaxID=615 RepID=UPI00274DF610|nr:Rz1-like lysis system protein LysC [Serratia marcescens]MDP8753886.1 Rz1-like lysis system protein LysC [Serratia marcescens]MDP8758547.1 Rz1-like lysis system protein LysC [Serratia marcescens]MDP8768288.1 Rz1-like lysis system protein LysC [Serratia marcescens]MDP8878392.1 Rz1-like lysis system protein LysC [Serratia marcescens]
MHLKAVNVGIVLCLPLLLSSCSRTPPTPQQVVLLPPETVFTPCEQPEQQGNTWGDAVSYTLALQTALSICTGQVATLSQWRTSIER